jgi:hypothetical protein
MMKTSGEAADGPTETVGYWWGDIYGEGSRMYFHGFSAVPEWAPPRENHILYSNDILKNIAYASTTVNYTATGNGGTDYLRLTFLPDIITVNDSSLPLRADLGLEGYTVRDLGNGDYSVNIKRAAAGDVYIS